MLRSRPAPIRRPTYRPTPVHSRPILRPRFFAQQSSAMRDLGREMNELTGFEARARSELSALQRQKLMKKAERMNDDAAQAKLQEEMRESDPNATMFGGAPEKGTEARVAQKLEAQKRRLKQTGNTAEAAEAYAKFDNAKRDFYEEQPTELPMKPASRATGAPKGNFEGEMAPTEAMHDEAEELAGSRKAGLHGTSGPRFDEAARKDEENILARSAEDEERREAAAFNKAARKATKAVTQKVSSDVMPKVAAGASMLMGAAATLKYKVVDEWAPKAMDILTDPAHVGDRAEEAKLRAEEAKRKLRRTVSTDNFSDWKEKAKDTAEEVKEKVDRWSETAEEKAEHWGGGATDINVAEDVKEAASATKDVVVGMAEKAKGLASAAKEKISRSMSSGNLRDMKEKASAKAEEVEDKVESWGESWTEASEDRAEWNETAKDTASAVKEKAKDIAGAAKQKIGRTMSSENVRDMKEKAYEGLEKGKEMAAEAKEKLDESAESGTLHDIKEVAGSAADKAIHVAAAAKDKIKNAMSPENVRDMKEKAYEAVKKGKEMATEAKEKLDESAESGTLHDIKEVAGSAADKATQVAAAAKEKIKRTLSSDNVSDMKEKASEAMEKGKEMATEAKEKIGRTMSSDNVRDMKEKATEKVEAVKQKSEDLAEDAKENLESWATREGKEAEAAGSRVWEKAKDVGETLKSKVQEKLKNAAHRVYERTADDPARAEESRAEEWQKLKSSAATLAGSASAIATEKLRQGVHVAAHKVEDVLSRTPAAYTDVTGTKKFNGFDLREENRKVTESAAEELFKEAEEARKKAELKLKQQRRQEMRP